MKIERIKGIYTEIEGLHLALDPDPASRGPKYLHDQISTCRNMINSISQIMLEIHQEHHNLAHELHAQQTLFEMRSNETLANNEIVKHLPSIEDRKAAIGVLHRTLLQTIANLKAQVQDLDYLEKAVRHQHRELKDTMAEIKLQRSLIRDEIESGSFYGDERAQPGKRSPGLPSSEDDISPEDIARIMEQEPGASETTDETEPVPVPEDAAEMLEETFGAFLADVAVFLAEKTEIAQSESEKTEVSVEPVAVLELESGVSSEPTAETSSVASEVSPSRESSPEELAAIQAFLDTGPPPEDFEDVFKNL